MTVEPEAKGSFKPLWIILGCFEALLLTATFLGGGSSGEKFWSLMLLAWGWGAGVLLIRALGPRIALRQAGVATGQSEPQRISPLAIFVIYNAGFAGVAFSRLVPLGEAAGIVSSQALIGLLYGASIELTQRSRRQRRREDV